MKIVDVNVLIYATDLGAARHRESRSFLEAALGGAEPLGLAWNVLLAFMRLSTKGQLFARPLSADQAIDVIESWLAQPAAVVVSPTDKHMRVVRSLLSPLGTAGNLTSDAHLAALAVEHGAVLVSWDHDFARFPGVQWRTPSP
ncbi:MAG: PIN domain-containing protein [Deltaproteobacteria bacterium]|nr:PIN domain-containing protein [Deltaproteobacteria bacterium]